jgi:hypothetical protein
MTHGTSQPPPISKQGFELFAQGTYSNSEYDATCSGQSIYTSSSFELFATLCSLLSKRYQQETDIMSPEKNLSRPCRGLLAFPNLLGLLNTRPGLGSLLHGCRAAQLANDIRCFLHLNEPPHSLHASRSSLSFNNRNDAIGVP